VVVDDTLFAVVYFDAAVVDCVIKVVVDVEVKVDVDDVFVTNVAENGVNDVRVDWIGITDNVDEVVDDIAGLELFNLRFEVVGLYVDAIVGIIEECVVKKVVLWAVAFKVV